MQLPAELCTGLEQLPRWQDYSHSGSCSRPMHISAGSCSPHWSCTTLHTAASMASQRWKRARSYPCCPAASPPESCTQMGDTTCRPCCRPHLTLSVWSPPATTCVTSGSVASVQLAPSCADQPPSVSWPVWPRCQPVPGACCRLGRSGGSAAASRKRSCRCGHGAAPSQDCWRSGICARTAELHAGTCVAVSLQHAGSPNNRGHDTSTPAAVLPTLSWTLLLRLLPSAPGPSDCRCRLLRCGHHLGMLFAADKRGVSAPGGSTAKEGECGGLACPKV